MNTEEYILLKDTNINLEKIQIPDLSKDELDLIENFVEYTRHIQEIDQLFHIFDANLYDILLHYELYNDDTIIRKIDIENKETDKIIINTLVINYISSAKTFTQSIENFLKEKLDTGCLERFKTNCISKIYDEKLSYRLLIRLRDYAQHGHLPVQMSLDKKCSFDLNQILYTPHFNHNPKLKAEMEKLRRDIFIKYESNPRIMFTLSIAEFQLCILEIYISFIKETKEKLVDLVNKVDDLIKNNPSIVYNSDDPFDGFVFYSLYDKGIQCFNPKQKPIDMVIDIEKDLKNKIEKATDDFEKLRKSYTFNKGT